MRNTQVCPGEEEPRRHLRLATQQPLPKNDLPGGQPNPPPCPSGKASLLPGAGTGRVPRFRGDASPSPPPPPPPRRTREDGAVCWPRAAEGAGPCTCSNPPASGAARRAEGGGREATAAVPGPGAAARLTARAWPAADALPTWARRGSPAGPCRVRLQPKTKQRTS